jgi:hypothetical protein
LTRKKLEGSHNAEKSMMKTSTDAGKAVGISDCIFKCLRNNETLQNRHQILEEVNVDEMRIFCYSFKGSG